MNINKLSEVLKQTNRFFKSKTTSAINISLTLRNWLFGFYIVEYEQKGEDKAKYGDKLLEEISKKTDKTITGLSVSHLRIYRQFYKTYPEIANVILEFSPEYTAIEKHQTLSCDLTKTDNLSIHQTLSDELKLLPQRKNKALSVPPQRIVKSLSFSHITELIKITDPLKRTFYEIESINGTWSVRELKRQIATLYYERSGLSRDKEKLHALVNQKTEKLQPFDILKNPFTFEFLGFRNREIIEETFWG
ncbi:MAG: DUF1016 domain-containing protein [Chlorobi bacterium]|nr:DUF1016 domain-containing protein [Chlorobiota bacterium]